MSNPTRYDAFAVGQSVWLNPDNGGPVFGLTGPVCLASEVDAWAAELREALRAERIAEAPNDLEHAMNALDALLGSAP